MSASTTPQAGTSSRPLAQARHTALARRKEHDPVDDDDEPATDGDDPVTDDDEPSADSDDEPSVVWSSPTHGQTIAAGDSIVGAWTSDEKVPSPSFSLCMSDGSDDSDANDSTCGETVHPDITQMDSGLSTMSLTAPDVEAAGQFYLMMQDDDGYEYRSPMFSLSPAAAEAASVNATSSASAPLSTIGHGSTSSTASATLSIPGAAGPTSIPTSVNLNAHPQPSTLALAIPLSLIGATMLAAFVMCCSRWRRSVKKRQQSPRGYAQPSAPYPFPSVSSNVSLGRSDDLEKAVSNLTAAAQKHSAPTRNLFLHPQLQNLEDKYTAARERSSRLSRQGLEDSAQRFSGPRLAAQGSVRDSWSDTSAVSFPSDHLDYAQAISSAPQPARRSATAGRERQPSPPLPEQASPRLPEQASPPFLEQPSPPLLEQPVYAPSAPTAQPEDDPEGDIFNSYLQPSPAPENWAKFSDRHPQPPPQVVYPARSRPLSNDIMAYKVQGEAVDAEPASQEMTVANPDVYQSVSQAIRKYSSY